MDSNYSSEEDSEKLSDRLIWTMDDVEINNWASSFRKTKWRWFALFLACFIVLGSYFCYDNPNALSKELKQKVTHDGSNEIKYNQLYSIYSYPNMILPLFGGVLIDKIGLNFATIFFSILLVIGQAVFAVSGYMGTEDRNNNFPYILALIGRFVFGLGGESLSVCQHVSVGRWFRGQELSLALGLSVSVSRLGSVFNNYSMPPISDHTSLGFALTFGLIIWVLSLIWSLFLITLEKYSQKVDNEDGRLNEDEKGEFKCGDIKKLSLAYWIIVANCLFIYIGVVWFNNISNDFFETRYGFNSTQSARITSNLYLISAFLAPIFGALSDKVGQKVSLWIVSCLWLTTCHILFIIFPSSGPENKSYLGMMPIILMGFANSIYVAVVWPMVILAVKPQVLGSACGLCIAILNIGLSIGPLVVGGLTFSSKGEEKYTYAIVSLAWFWFLGLCSAIFLFIIDKVDPNWHLNEKTLPNSVNPNTFITTFESSKQNT